MTKVVKVQKAETHLSALIKLLKLLKLLKLVESGEDVVISERRARCVGGVIGVELAVTATHALLAGSLAWEHRVRPDARGSGDGGVDDARHPGRGLGTLGIRILW